MSDSAESDHAKKAPGTEGRMRWVESHSSKLLRQGLKQGRHHQEMVISKLRGMIPKSPFFGLVNHCMSPSFEACLLFF